MKFVLMALVSLFTFQAFAYEELTLNFRDRIFEPEGRLYLKEKARERYDDFDPNEFQLVQVILQAKSRYGAGQATLELSGDVVDRAKIPGIPQKFDNTFDGSYYDIGFNVPPGADTDGTWQIGLRGNVRVNNVKLVLRRQSSSRRMQAIYRLFNSRVGDHMLSVSPVEGQDKGYRFEGVACFLPARPAYRLNPLFRCYTGRSHFASLDPQCEGQRAEGILGFISPESRYKFKTPLYRCYNPASGDHLITIDAWECSRNNYTIESVLGYVP